MTRKTVARSTTKRQPAAQPVALSARSCQGADMPRDSKQRRMTPAEGLKRARDTGKVVHIAHGAGLYLACTPNGAASWRVRYRFAGRVDTKVLGRLEHMNAREAMEARLGLAKLIQQGADPKPIALQSVAGAGATFSDVAARWVREAAKNRPWTAAYRAAVESKLDRYVLPIIGPVPITMIDVAETVKLITGIQYRSIRHCVLEYLNSIFSVAVSEGIAQTNPVQIALAAKRVKMRDDKTDREKQNQARLVDVAEVRKVMLGLEATRTHPMLKLAHRFLALTAVRKREALEARWSEIKRDPKGWRWVIPKGRMKATKPHEVILSKQAVDVLLTAEGLQKDLRVDSPFVFARRNQMARPFSPSALHEVYTRLLPQLGLAPEVVDTPTGKRRRQQHCVHGWRGSFSTISAENDQAENTIERCLAHAVGTRTQKAYDHALYRKPKAALWQAWADLLMTPDVPPASALVPDGQSLPSNVVPFKNREAA